MDKRQRGDLAMIFCPKCGFKNELPQATDCPKCGLIYSKFQHAQAEEKNHISAERALNEELRKAFPQEISSHSSFTDFETSKDHNSYPILNNLSVFFMFFAGILAIFTIVEAKYIWSLLSYLNSSFEIFKTADKVYITIAAIFIGTMQVSMFLAIGCLLRIGKDIADNTRATRNYLLYLARNEK